VTDWIIPPSPSIGAAPPPEPEPPRDPGPPPNPPRPPRRRKSGPRAWRVWAAAAGVVLAVALVCAGLGGLAVKRFLDETPQIPDHDALVVVSQTPGMTFEDRTGAIIATRGPKHGYPVTLAELPPYVPQAFLAVEDRRFYHHGPVDLRGMARALWANWRAHRTVQGGSTLTQQLAKTLFLTPKQTLRRKLEEAVIAWRLERAMSKDQVLELYLNRIFFGDNAYGVDAAAETYFDKPARALDLQEAALLAALPKAPTRLALTNDMAAALARSRLVLANMRAEGWIDDDQERAALADPPRLAPERPGEGQYGYILDMAAAQAVQIAGARAPDLVVRLSIDPALQAQAQGFIHDTLASEGARAGVSQGAMVLLATDGAVRALVGGADHRLSAFNRATQAQRQPGSAFKPFVYAAALENGVKPTDIRPDAPVRFGPWTPTNYEGGYRGPVSVADALAYSINTVAVRLASEVGGAKIGEIAHRFGLKSIPDQPDLSVALGAYEVNLLELTSGYQVFQQGGRRVAPYLIEQITNTRGERVFAHAAGPDDSVYDAAHAGEMVRMMEGVLTKGTAERAAFGRPAAGKTGTTQNWRDAWFVGFTPDWVCGVWIGNDDDRSMNKITGGQIPAEIWRRMMVAAHKNLPVRDFAWMPPPDPVEQPEPSGEPAVETAAAGADADPRTGFYDQLSADFGRAADVDAPPAVDAPPPAAQREDGR
jgi:penicillin-binding protein 1A